MERLLYIPNEFEFGWQRGQRSKLESMLSEGELDDYVAFALPFEADIRGSLEDALKDLEALATEMQPTLVLWQHIIYGRIPGSLFRRLRALDSRPLLAYQDFDCWGWVRKPLPKGSRRLAKEADVVYLCGLGSLERVFRLRGARRVRYTHWAYDPDQFGLPWNPTTEREFDVVMIGNRHIPRVPGRRFPGNRARERLAGLLHARLGSRFACFGAGWDSFPFDRGPIPYSEQSNVNRTAWVTVGWDHFTPTPFYFSDRLPIALASGVIHVTSRQPGYEAMFPPEHGLYWSSTITGVVQTVEWLLRQPRSYLLDRGARAAELAHTGFNQHDQVRDVIADLSTLRSRLNAVVR